MDETTLRLRPPLRACWMKAGQQKCIPVGNMPLRKTWHVFGAYNWRDDTLVTMLSEHENSETFVAFLEHVLLEVCPTQPIVWVMDNASWHLSAMSQAALSLFEQRVLFCYLPAYCSDLNLLERFWNHLKQQACANRPFADFDAKFAAVLAILDIQNTPAHPDRFHLSKEFR
jgi:transposase